MTRRLWRSVCQRAVAYLSAALVALGTASGTWLWTQAQQLMAERQESDRKRTVWFDHLDEEAKRLQRVRACIGQAGGNSQALDCLDLLREPSEPSQ